MSSCRVLTSRSACTAVRRWGCTTRTTAAATAVVASSSTCRGLGLLSSRLAPPSSFTSALSTQARAVASYPTPRCGTRTRKSKKQYNYLTGERLVKTPRATVDRQALRARDDVALQRRRNYREDLRRDVEEKIRFFSPEEKSYVFFPQSRSHAVHLLFKGNRSLPSRTFTRLYVSVIDRLCEKKNRPELIRLMQAVGVEPPTTATFNKYSDKATGRINIPLIYSRWMERYFYELGRKYATAVSRPRLAKGRLDTEDLSMSPLQAYVLLHFGDEAAVPSIMSWSHALGPIRPATEFVEGGRQQESVTTLLRESRMELMTWGQCQLDATLAPMTVEEQQALVDEAIRSFEPHMRLITEQLHFVSKVMLAINSLPEVKSMQAPSKVFLKEKELQAVEQQQGLYFPPSPYAISDWRALSQEEQQEYYCFKRKSVSMAISGLQLYARYCARDYGMSRADGAKRFSRLSDEQQAALNFPFYYPITPKNSAVVAFRKFYWEMCQRYGLSRTSSNLSVANRVFESTMRTKWKMMPAAERQQYFNDDTILAAFPLQPKRTEKAAAAAGTDGASAAAQKEGDVVECEQQAEEEEKVVESTAVTSATAAKKKGTALRKDDVLRLAKRAEKQSKFRPTRKGRSSPATRSVKSSSSTALFVYSSSTHSKPRATRPSRTKSAKTNKAAAASTQTPAPSTTDAADAGLALGVIVV